MRIEVSRAATTAENITQTLVPSGGAPHDKRDTLRRIISGADNFKNALIFCNRKRDVQVVYRSLQKHGFSVDALHGDLDQRARMAALDAFRGGQVQLLVCSDVAARGLDIPDVSHVINYDAPHHSEDYVHRIGRTGRAGKAGQALTIVTRGDSKAIAEIEKLIARKIDWLEGAEMPAEDEPSRRGARPRARADATAKRGGERGGRAGERDRRRAKRRGAAGQRERGGRRREDAPGGRGPRPSRTRSALREFASSPRRASAAGTRGRRAGAHPRSGPRGTSARRRRARDATVRGGTTTRR